MKFLFISNIYPPHVRGGYELGCQMVAQAMKKLGHEVRVATSVSVGYLNRTGEDREVSVEKIFEPVFGYEALLDAELKATPGWMIARERAFAGCIPSNAIALARLLGEYQPDVIWIFNPLGLGPIGILEAALTFPARRLIHLMDDVDGVVENHCSTMYSVPRLRRLKRYFSAISCSFKTMADNERIGSYRTHRVIFNGVDFNAIVGSESSKEQQREAVTRLVYFGQVEVAKGLRQIIVAAERAQRRGRTFEIDIFGTGDSVFRSELMARIAEAGLESCVQLKGFINRSELFERLPDYDAAIMLLSGQEPFAYSMVEAATAGLPVMITSNSGNAESLPDDYPLLVHNRDDPDEVCRQICWICDNPEAASNLGRELRSHLQKQCDLSTVTLPAYLRVVRATPLLTVNYQLESTLAVWSTCEHYAFASRSS